MYQAELIEAAKTKARCSEAEIARRIEISPQVLNRIKKGEKAMPDRIAAKLATLAGRDPATVVAEIEAEKAGSEMKGIWKEIARRTSRAAVLAIAVTVALAGAFPGKSEANQGVKSGDAFCILCQLMD